LANSFRKPKDCSSSLLRVSFNLNSSLTTSLVNQFVEAPLLQIEPWQTVNVRSWINKFCKIDFELLISKSKYLGLKKSVSCSNLNLFCKRHSRYD